MPCLALVHLAAAALGPWTYAGFVADPPPIPTPAPAPAAAAWPARPTPPPAIPIVPAATAAPGPPGPASRPIAFPRYRLADATGQVWEHADPAWLQTFVAGRNASMSRPLVARPACTGGRCR